MCFKNLFKNTSEQPSPQDWLPHNAMSCVGGLLTIDLSKLNIKLHNTPIVWIPAIPDSNSMDGVFDYGNNNILIKGTSAVDQKTLVDALIVGDIAVYNNIIHRIVKIGTDKGGKYFRFKGDNNSGTDPTIVRESDIRYVSVGCIY